MDILPLILVTKLAFFVSILAMILLRPSAVALGLVDRPGGHKTHHGEVPVVGGLAMFTGIVIAAAFGADLGEHGHAMLAIAALMVLVGALDDRFRLPATGRLVVHLFAATFLFLWTGFAVPDLGNLLGFGTVQLWFLGPLFTIVACVALINAFNMLDGLDGLAGGCALMGCAALAVIAFQEGAQTSAIVSSCMVGGILGFLLFNVPVIANHPFRTFMGDAGSTLLGFVIAALALTLIQTDRADVSPIVVPWVFSIPVFELFASTFRRLRRGSSPFDADNGHFHHVLLRAGLSVRFIFVLYFVSSAVLAIFGVWANRHGVPEYVMFAGLVASFLAWLLFVYNAHRVVAFLPDVFRRLQDYRAVTAPAEEPGFGPPAENHRVQMQVPVTVDAAEK